MPRKRKQSFEYYDFNEIENTVKDLLPYIESFKDCSIVESYVIYAPIYDDKEKKKTLVINKPCFLIRDAQDISPSNLTTMVPLIKVRANGIMYWLTINSIKKPSEDDYKRLVKQKILEKVKDRLTKEELEILLG